MPRGARRYLWGSEGRGGNEAPLLRTRHLAQSPLTPPRPVPEEAGPTPWPLSRAQRLLQVEPLKEALAQLIGADHDGAGRGGLDDPWEEACSGRARLGSEGGSQRADSTRAGAHTGTLTCEEPPGARLGPDPPQQQPGGVSARGRHCRQKARPSKTPLGPPRAPTPHQPTPHLSLPPPLPAQPDVESLPRRRVESGWLPPGGWGGERVGLRSQAPVPCTRPGSASPIAREGRLAS